MGSLLQSPRLIRNTILDLCNRLFVIATAWIISIWVARQLGPTNYGIFALVLWFTGNCTWVVGMGFTHAITKFVAEYSSKGQIAERNAIIFFVLKTELVLTIGGTLILIFFKSQIADYFFSPSESFFFFLAFLGLLPGILTAVFSATIEGVQKFEYFFYANLIIGPFSFISKIIVLVLDMGIEGLLTVMLIFSVVNTVFYSWVLIKENVFRQSNKKPLDRNLLKRILRYNFSVWVVMLCDKIIWDKSENFFLGRFCSATEVGFYNLGYNITQKFTTLLPATFWRVLFPAMSGYAGAGDRKKMCRVFFLATRYLAFISFPVGVGGAILAYNLIHYLYGHEFIGAQRVLQILFLASIINSMAEPGAAVLYGYEKQSFIYKLGGFMAGVNIVLDILFIRDYGAVGAAWCYAVTTIIGSICGTVYTCMSMKLRYPVVSVAKIFLSTVIMGISMKLILHENSEIWGFIAAVVGGSTIYIVCALVLGTFEQEDYTLLESIEAILPGKVKKLVRIVRFLIGQFKNSSENTEK